MSEKEEKRNQYQDLIHQTLEAIPTKNEKPDETINIEEMWKKIKNAIREVADITMEPIKHTKSKVWFDIK